MQPLPVSTGSSNDYKELDEVLSSKPEHIPVCLNDFAASDHYTRCHWTGKLGLLYKVLLIQYPYGNNSGILSFVRKVPQQADEIVNAQMMLQASQDVQKYSTGICKGILDLTDQYQHFCHSFQEHSSAHVSGSQQ